MPAISVPRRPFSSDLFTGLALPDGIFETSIGAQRINAHFANTAAGAAANMQVYIESSSDPGIVITPQTHVVAAMAPGAERLLTWEADFSSATPGTHRIGFVAEFGATRVRMIKKILVTKVSFNPATASFSAQFPEGTFGVTFGEFVGPENGGCCGNKRRSRDGGNDAKERGSLLDYIRQHGSRHDVDFVFCLKQYLLGNVSLSYTPNPPYPGQYSDLPFQDPWLKVLLCVIALLLLIGAAIAEAVDGTGSVTTSGGPGGADSPAGDCCGLAPSGGGTSYIAAGLVAAAAAVATAAALSDVRDPFRRGQDNTAPAAGEITIEERVETSVSYIDTIALGRPFAVNIKWKYTRQTNANTYYYSVAETQRNVHVLSKYEIKAPDIVRLYKKETFIVRAKFFDADEKLMRGGQLFVQCLMAGPNGEFRRFVLQDDGGRPDSEPNDGEYTGSYDFNADVHVNPAAKGVWMYFVIAQDVNAATPQMTPEEAAALIGGMVVTHQLSIEFTGGTCPLTPDGHVTVV